MSGDSDAPVSAVEAKLARIAELATQIAGEEERLEEFWEKVAQQLADAAAEVWSHDLLETGVVQVFGDEAVGEVDGDLSGERGLQLGFARCADAADLAFVVRPAFLAESVTLYTQLEHPEPEGKARPLSSEPRQVRLAALHQLPELLDAILGGLNDTLAVVRTALGDPVETQAMVSSPFSRRLNGGSSAAIPAAPGASRSEPSG